MSLGQDYPFNGPIWIEESFGEIWLKAPLCFQFCLVTLVVRKWHYLASNSEINLHSVCSSFTFSLSASSPIQASSSQREYWQVWAQLPWSELLCVLLYPTECAMTFSHMPSRTHAHNCFKPLLSCYLCTSSSISNISPAEPFIAHAFKHTWLDSSKSINGSFIYNLRSHLLLLSNNRIAFTPKKTPLSLFLLSCICLTLYTCP